MHEVSNKQQHEAAAGRQGSTAAELLGGEH